LLGNLVGEKLDVSRIRMQADARPSFAGMRFPRDLRLSRAADALMDLVFHEYSTDYDRLYREWLTRLDTVLPEPAKLLEGYERLAPVADEWGQMALDQWRSSVGKSRRRLIPPYRDHVLHPITITFLGEDLLDNAGTGFGGRLADHVRHNYGINDRGKIADVCSWAWNCAALFHDVGYRVTWRLASLKGAEANFRGVLDAIRYQAHYRLVRKQGNPCVEACKNGCQTCRTLCLQDCLGRLFATGAAGGLPHGVIGAYELARRCQRGDPPAHRAAWELACRAIMLHDAKPNSAGTGKHALAEIRLQEEPLAFLLRLLDILHECGRLSLYTRRNDLQEGTHSLRICERVPRMRLDVCASGGRLRVTAKYLVDREVLKRTNYTPAELVEDKAEGLSSLSAASGHRLRAQILGSVKQSDLLYNNETLGVAQELVGLTVAFRT